MNVKRPEISIIIPVYNTQDYVRNCLQSVQNQTFQDWEAICINDGSTDESLKILEKFYNQDKRFKIYNQNNQGVSAARNKGLEVATGKYIMFLDSDDFIHPQCMEISLSALISSGADICDFLLNKIKHNQYVTPPRKIRKTISVFSVNRNKTYSICPIF